MKSNNVIVLTTGLSGSSVVTGLIAQDGFWLGDKTVFKSNTSGKYETYENSRLIELNDNLLSHLNIKLNESSWYDAKLFKRVEEECSTIDKNEYIEFIRYCQQHGKWIWKDPRLWITINFWEALLTEIKVKYVVLSREPISLWTSMLNKRQIVGFFDLKHAENKSNKLIVNYLSNKNKPFISVSYDQLVEYPQKEISRLNIFLGTSLTLADFEHVYTGVIGSKTFKYKSFVKAILIYIKNLHLVKRL